MPAKAISIRQPWALLIVGEPGRPGPKDIENRTWGTKYRGPLLIHAGKSLDVAALRGMIAHPDHLPPEARFWQAANAALVESPQWWGSKLGGIVGRVDLVDCLPPAAPCPSSWAQEGLWHWKLANPVAFPKPIPPRGRLGLFEVSGDSNRAKRSGQGSLFGAPNGAQ